MFLLAVVHEEVVGMFSLYICILPREVVDLLVC